MITKEAVIEALSQVQEPDLGKDLVTLNMVKDIEIDGKNVSFTVILTTPACPLKDMIEKACVNAIRLLVDKEAIVKVHMTANVNSNRKDNKSVLEHEIPDSCTPVILIPKQETIISELVYALQKGLEGDISVNRFHFYTGQNYFFEIARLRAFRWLWKQVCQLKNEPYQLTVFCETAIQNGDDKYEYSNILRNTTAAMSAVLGGSDAVIINSHDIHNGNSDFGKRIARNIHHILQQEAYFAEIEDAVKGSYYIEYLTFKLAQKAWEQFRNS